MTNFLKFGVRATAAALLALLAAACAAPGGMPSSEGETARAAVLARADGRGAALVHGDMDAAYAFLTEGSKSVITLENFKRRMTMVPFTAYRIDDASCAAESCTVHAKLTYNHRLIKGVTTPITETWVRERGQFYFVFPPI
ncbi:MAG: hypothetical protein ABI585_02990 [Betaproteobacteria bacterium]